jgi:putative lipoprotein
MIFLRLFLLLLLATVLPATAGGERIRYTCDNGSRLDISFSHGAEGRPQATLHFADGDVVLPQVPAASGALYRADPIRLHTKDDDAVFEDAKGNARRCRKGEPVATPPAAATSSFIDVTGTVSFATTTPLPPDAVLIVRIQDTSRADAKALTLAEQRIELAGLPLPIPFAMTVDRDLAGKRARITASARIERAGKLLFISDKVYPAIVGGRPHQVDLTLKAVGATPKR